MLEKLKTFFTNIIPFYKNRTPIVLQMEVAECGAAALSVIMGFYGLFVPLEKIRVRCGVSRDGSKASNIVKAANSYGLTCEAYRADVLQLMEDERPCIVFWEQNHFLVVERFSKKHVYLNDPAMGRYRVSLLEFAYSYSGIVMYFEPNERFVPSDERPNFIKQLQEKITYSKGPIAVFVAISFLLLIPGLVMPGLSKVFIDDILVKGMKSWTEALLVVMVITIFLTMGLQLIQRRVLVFLKLKLATVETTKFFWHVLKLPVEFYTQRYSGDIINRLDAIDDVTDLLAGNLGASIVSVFSSVIFAIIMFYYDVVLTLIVFASIAFNFLFYQLFTPVLTEGSMRLQKEEGLLQATAMSGLNSIEALKASAREDDFFERWSGFQAREMNSQLRMNMVSHLIGSVPNIMEMISGSIIMLIGVIRIVEGDMTFGTLVAFQALAGMINDPIDELIDIFVSVKKLKGDIVRVNDVLMYPSDDSIKTNPMEDDLSITPALQGYVELRDVCFGYNPIETPLINHFNLTLTPGQRIALVGKSGSGKSTIIRLILGLYKPFSGEILFDGTKREDWPRLVLLNSVANVDQDIFMFEGSLRDNLTLWDRTIPEEDIIAALKDAEIYDAVMSRPQGIDTKIGTNGNNFSGGQIQRLEIARALVKNPSVLVLDEATSALDAETEKKIDDNLRKRGCTTIIVAHRLSTIRDADEIIVMEGGRILDRGVHDHLVKVCEYYRELVSFEQ